MRVFHYFLALIIAILFWPINALACSCSENITMAGIVESGAVIILASPVGTTRVKVWKSYAGEAKAYEDLNTIRGSSCTLEIPNAQTSIIVGSRAKSGKLQTSICSAVFTNAQWMKFLQTGEDTPPRDICYQHIKQAFDAESFSGEFKLDRADCEVHLDDYVSKFQKRVSD